MSHLIQAPFTPKVVPACESKLCSYIRRKVPFAIRFGSKYGSSEHVNFCEIQIEEHLVPSQGLAIPNIDIKKLTDLPLGITMAGSPFSNVPSFGTEPLTPALI